MPVTDFDLDVSRPTLIPVVMRAASHWYQALADQASLDGNQPLRLQWEKAADFMSKQAGYLEEALARGY